MPCVTFNNDPNPNAGTTANQIIFNTETKENLDKLNTYALNRRQSFYTSARQSPASTTVTLTASQGANQYVGLVSGAVPGALTNVLLPITADMTPMDSFFFQDESINSNTYAITLKTQSIAKIYGPGLAAGGVTSVQITDAGGYKELLYVTTNKWYLIRKSA